MHHDLLTKSLSLTPLISSDIDWVHELFSDPRGWTHDIGGLHTELADTQAFLDRVIAGWRHNMLSYWAARIDTEQPAGMGGVRRIDRHWNLGFRIFPDYQGRGLATEIATAAIDAAHETESSIPVFAWVDESNAASRTVVGRIGLIDHGLQNDHGELRRVFVDRPHTFPVNLPEK